MKMKKGICTLSAVLLLASGGAMAQKENAKKGDEGFVFTTIKEIPITSIKDQNRSGTCWAYSSLGFFEAELLRTDTSLRIQGLQPSLYDILDPTDISHPRSSDTQRRTDNYPYGRRKLQCSATERIRWQRNTLCL